MENNIAMIKEYLSAKRRMATGIYTALFMAEAFLVAWLISAYSVTVQIIFLFAEAAWLFLLLRLPSRLALQGAFARPLEGVIQKMECKPYEKPCGILKREESAGQTVRLILYVETGNSTLREVILENDALQDVLQPGDRILYAKGLAAPLLLDRRSGKYVCPICGNIFPATYKACPQCTMPIYRAEKSEE